MRKILLLVAVALPLAAWPVHSRIQIAATSEPGQRLTVSGRVLDERGRPMPNVAVYVYHTDANGLYRLDRTIPRWPESPPRLQGWLRTDADGSYAIDTIAPGSYPGTKNAPHIHFEFHAAGYPKQDQTVHFDRVAITKDAESVLHIAHDFRLSMNPPQDR